MIAARQFEAEKRGAIDAEETQGDGSSAETAMSLITSPLDGRLFRFDVGRGECGIVTTCNYLPLNMASAEFDARDPGYQSKFMLHVARALLDNPPILEQALKSVDKLDDTVELFLINPASRTVSHLTILDRIRNPDAIFFWHTR